MSKRRLAGWILSVLIAAFLIFASASGKFVDFEGKEEMFAKLGWTVDRMKPIGVVEVAGALVFLLPQTAFVGAILLTGYLGGATATHARIGDPLFPEIAMPIFFGVLVWTAYALQRPDVVGRAFRTPSDAHASS